MAMVKAGAEKAKGPKGPFIRYDAGLQAVTMHRLRG